MQIHDTDQEQAVSIVLTFEATQRATESKMEEVIVLNKL